MKYLNTLNTHNKGNLPTCEIRHVSKSIFHTSVCRYLPAYKGLSNVPKLLITKV